MNTAALNVSSIPCIISSGRGKPRTMRTSSGTLSMRRLWPLPCESQTRISAGPRSRTPAMAALTSPVIHTLALQQRPLPRRVPPVPALAAGGGNDAMTGDRDRDGIPRARARDGARRLRSADCRCDFRVRAGLAVRDRGERLPYLPLKRCRLDVDRQIERRPPSVEVREDRGGPFREGARIGDDRRCRVLAREQRV